MTHTQGEPPSNLQNGEHQFDLDAGRACLDFVNTSTPRSGDQLTSYADLVAFAIQSGLTTRQDAAWLRQEAVRDPRSAQIAFARAQRLRDALRGLFTAALAGRHPRRADVGRFDTELLAALKHARVLPKPGGGFAWTFSGDGLDQVLWPITRSAADVLTSDQDMRLLRQCAADDCKWLFLDTTRNRSRQWCSMASCGNREKARRHYQRVRTTRGTRERSARRASHAGASVSATAAPADARSAPGQS